MPVFKFSTRRRAVFLAPVHPVFQVSGPQGRLNRCEDPSWRSVLLAVGSVEVWRVAPSVPERLRFSLSWCTAIPRELLDVGGSLQRAISTSFIQGTRQAYGYAGSRAAQ